jgi:PAS domain S-box-containing protein
MVMMNSEAAAETTQPCGAEKQSRAYAAELQALNASLEERNQQLQQLADDLAASALAERQALDALRESEGRLQAILDNSTAVVYLKDTESRFLLINRRFETLFHFTRDQVLGRTNHDVFPKEWADAFRANDLQVLERRTPLEFEEIVPQDDGIHTYLSVKFPLSNSAGVVYGVCGISTDITERKRAEVALRESEARLQAILDNSPAAVYVKDTAGRFVLINRGFETLFHISRSQVVGKTNHDLFPKEWADVILSNDRKVIESKAPLECEESAPQEDGVHTFLSIKFPLGNAAGEVYGICGIDTDITARKRAEAALRASEERIRLIVDAAHDAFVGMDAEGLIKNWNSQAESIFGWAREEVLGRPLVETIIPPRYRQAHIRGLHHFLATGEGPILNQRLELTALHKNGREFPVELTIRPIRLGSTYLFSSFLHDITERKRAEEQLRLQNTQLQELAQSEHQAHEALKKAQSQLVQSEKLASLGQLVAGVAHEINNPLSFVSNNVAVLQREVHALRDLLALYQEGEALLAEHRPELHGRIREFAERIDLNYTLSNLDGLVARSRDGLKRIQQIVKDLRDFARLDESDLHEVDLNAGIASTVNIIQGQAKKQQVALELDLTPLPGVSCYPAKINQVVLNLLSNALDACSAGGKVTVSTRTNGDGVEVLVTDTGSGIDPAIRERVFDPFFTTKPQGQGTGLGLSISYGIVQMHGGTIDFESTPGQGTRFRVWLPGRLQKSEVRGQRSEVRE